MFVVTREVDVCGTIVTVKELTVAEIRAWLSEPTPTNDDREIDLLTDLMNFDGIGMDELHRFTDLKKDMIEQLPPSAISKIAAVIKELNTVFFNQYVPALNKLRERLDAVTSEVSNAV